MNLAWEKNSCRRATCPNHPYWQRHTCCNRGRFEATGPWDSAPKVYEIIESRPMFIVCVCKAGDFFLAVRGYLSPEPPDFFNCTLTQSGSSQSTKPWNFPVATCQGPVRASLMTLPALSQLVLATGDATFAPWRFEHQSVWINDFLNLRFGLPKYSQMLRIYLHAFFSNGLYNYSNLRTWFASHYQHRPEKATYGEGLWQRLLIISGGAFQPPCRQAARRLELVGDAIDANEAQRPLGEILRDVFRTCKNLRGTMLYILLSWRVVQTCWLRLGLVDFVGSEARTEKYVAVGHIAYSWCEFQCHALQSAVENEICRLIYRNCSPSSEYFMCPSMNIWSFEAHYTHALRLDPGTNRTWWKQCAKKKRTRRLCCRHLQDGPRSETLEGHLFQPNSHHCQRKAAAPSNASLFQRTDAALPSFTVPCYVAHVRRKMLQRFDWLWCKIHWMTFHCSFVPFQIVLACHFGTESSQFSGVQWSQATVHDLDPIYLCIALQEDIKTSFSVVFSFFFK